MDIDDHPIITILLQYPADTKAFGGPLRYGQDRLEEKPEVDIQIVGDKSDAVFPQN